MVTSMSLIGFTDLSRGHCRNYFVLKKGPFYYQKHKLDFFFFFLGELGETN